jgi:hypothetical protein
MSPRRRSRDGERERLEALWKTNCKRREEGGWLRPVDWANASAEQQAEIAFWLARDQRFAELQAKVEAWPNRKEIAGEDVMEILGISFALTNNAAYEKAQEAMKLHRLDKGGLARAFKTLQRRHREPPEYSCVMSVEPEPDNVTWYREEFGYSVREAAAHVAADQGIPGTSFDNAVEKVRAAYARRKQLDAEHHRYLGELSGLRDPHDIG